MLELVVHICLQSDPAKCREEALTFSTESVTPMQCLMSAQPVIAQHMELRPRWVCKKWSCRPAGQYAKA
jgi:hypothetical protein